MVTWWGTAASAQLTQQVIRPDGVSLALTGTDTVETGTVANFGVSLQMITPQFKGKLSPSSGTVVVKVVNSVVSQVLSIQSSSQSLPAVPADGYILLGAGIGATFLSPLQIGDEVKVVSKEASGFADAPSELQIGVSTYSISGINTTRGTDQLIIYTPAFGTHTFTNEWGMEAAVVGGQVVAIRPYQNKDLFAIPENGYVISAHGAGRGWLSTRISIGTPVSFVGEESTVEAVPNASALSSEPVRDGKVAFPIVNTPFRHEGAQFGYQPWYVRNEVTFDSYNRPYIRYRTDDLDETGYIQTMRHSRWVKLDFTPAIKAAFPNFGSYIRGGGWNGATVVFDADDDLYTIVTIRLTDNSQYNVLLYSTDYGDTFQVYKLPDGVTAIEQWVGHNSLNRPPLIGVYRMRADHPATYASYNTMQVLQPVKKKDGLSFLEPVLVTNNSLSPSQHSGGASFAVSCAADKAFITWVETVDANTTLSGAPTYVATYDINNNQIVDKSFIAYAPPVNDGHNTPGIAIDSQGYLHVISGAHGDNFFYAKSLEPYSTGSGWTTPVPVLQTGAKNLATGVERGRQTYLAFLIDAQDTLHIAFRQWRENIDPYFYGRLYGALSYQQKPVGQPWSDATPLIVPPVPTYSIYYHKLHQDRAGRLYLSYSFRSNVGDYNFETPVYQWRALITSADSGQSWKLATSQDFATGVFTDAPSYSGEPGYIQVQVIDRYGSPLAGVTLEAGVFTTETDEEGRATFEDLYVDVLTLTARKTEYRTWVQEITLPQGRPQELVIALRTAEEVVADFGALFSSGLRFGVESTPVDDRWRVDYSNKLGTSGFTLRFDQNEGYWAICFEARAIQPNSQELTARVTHLDGVETLPVQLNSQWQEYRMEAPNSLTQFNLASSGQPSIIEIRNVRLVK
jgi:hypothetical protein